MLPFNSDHTQRQRLCIEVPASPKSARSNADETVLDGEVVALDASGRPSFNALQNYSSMTAPIFYYVFDVLVLKGRTVMNETLDVRREMLRSEVLPKLREPIRYAEELHGSVPDLLKAVRAYGFEGLVAKRRDSLYESGKRSGAWRKVRVNQGQEFVIGGYTVGGNPFDALVLGYHEGTISSLSQAHAMGSRRCCGVNCLQRCASSKLLCVHFQICQRKRAGDGAKD